MARVGEEVARGPLLVLTRGVAEYIADDRIWFWAMGTARIHDERIRRGEVMSSANDVAVQNMIRLGLYDWTADDRPWDGSTRSMRYAAVVSDRLSLGASGGVPTRNTARTSQGNGQCTSNEPTWNTASTF